MCWDDGRSEKSEGNRIHGDSCILVYLAGFYATNFPFFLNMLYLHPCPHFARCLELIYGETQLRVRASKLFTTDYSDELQRCGLISVRDC